jgi:putative ABC transport system permease protein
VNNPVRTVSLRNLAAHKVRLLLTVISVVLGTAFIAGSFVFTDTLNRTFSSLVTTVDKGIGVRVEARKSISPGVPVALAERFKSLPGVRAVQLDVSGPVVVVGPDGKRLQSGGAPSQGGNWTPASESITTPAVFVSGHAPIGDGQVVINESAATKAKLHVGDQLRVITLSHGAVDATLSGIYHVGTATGGYIGVLFDQPEALMLFTDGSHVADVDIAAQAGVSQSSLRDRVAAILPASLEAKTGDQVHKDDEDAVQKALSFVNYFLLAFGAIALLVGTFIIYNTFSMIVAQRLRELALLRALGASRGQVRRSVVLEAGLIGIIGSVIGVAGGVGLAFGLRALLDALNLGLPGGGLVLSSRTIVVALVVGTGVTLVSAYSPARRAAKIPPVAAMREEFATTTAASLRRRNRFGSALFGLGAIATVAGVVASSAGTGSLLIGVGLLGVGTGVLLLAPKLSGWIIGPLAVLVRPFGAVGRLSETNAVRNPRRTAATAFALTLGLLLVSGIGVVGASTKATVRTVVNNDVRADYILSGGSFGVPTAAVAAVQRVPGVASITQFESLVTEINGSQDSGAAVDGPLAGVFRLDIIAGSGSPTGTNMLVSKSESTSRDWKIGTKVVMNTPGAATVTRVVRGIYADDDLLGSWVVSGATYRLLTPSSSYFDVAALVKATPGTNLAVLRADLVNAVNRYYVVEVQNRQQYEGSQAAMVNGLLDILYALLGLAIVIAVLGIINTLALSVVERRREIGMLRAIGMKRSQVRRTIYLESALISMFGAILGLALGLGYGALFTRELRTQGLTSVDVPWGQAAAFFVISGLVGVLAALWPGIRASRIPPLAVIVEG